MIYENICKLAKERGISINKLEEKANVSTGSICKWGNSVSPTVKNIKKDVIIISSMERSRIREMLLITVMATGSML